MCLPSKELTRSYLFAGLDHCPIPSLGLRGQGVYLLDVQLPHHLSAPSGVDRYRLLSIAVPESGAPIAVDGQSDAPLLDRVPGALGNPGCPRRRAGRPSPRRWRPQFRSPLFQQWVLAAVDLCQHALLGIATTLQPVLSEPSSSRGWHACIMNPMTDDLEQLGGEVEGWSTARRNPGSPSAAWWFRAGATW